MADETKTAIDEFDAKHGTPGADHKPMTEEQEFGTNQNPLRETVEPWSKLEQVGK
jgi:hypothetical protein